MDGSYMGMAMVNWRCEHWDGYLLVACFVLHLWV